MPNKRSKRYNQCIEKVPEEKQNVAEAVNVIKSFPQTKFDPTVELSMQMGIDPRQSDQRLRGAISLPNGIGKSRKVIAFCEGQDTEQAKQAGAIEAGADELIQKVQDGWTDFDVALSTPAMMKKVSKLGRVLGPQGKMPSPKAGTVTDDVLSAVREYSAGKVEFRNDDGGNIHATVGRAGFPPEKLVENIEYFITQIKKMRPATTKGAYIKRACLSTTMSPSVELDVR